MFWSSAENWECTGPEARISKFLDEQGIEPQCPKEAYQICLNSMLGKRKASVQLEDLCFKLISDHEF